MNKSHYLLKDLQEIFGIFETLEFAYNYILQFIYNFYRYNKLLNINSIINNIQIIEYNDNNIYNIYIFNKNFQLINNNYDTIIFNNIYINDIVDKLQKINNSNSNELNIFIPNNFFDTDTINNNDNNEINCELQILQDKIETLKNIKGTENEFLNKIKENIKNKEEEIYIKKSNNLSVKKKFENKKEYYNKMKNKFKIDKDIYFKLREEITNGERTLQSLPELFIDEFNIFQKLELENKINLELSDDIFEEYLKYKPEKTQNFMTNFDHIFINYDSKN